MLQSIRLYSIESDIDLI